MSSSDTLVVTAGEPAGIGPDLCLKLAQEDCDVPFVVVSDPDLLRHRADMLGARVSIHEIPNSIDGIAKAAPGHMHVIPTPFPVLPQCGQPDARNAQTLLDGLRLAVEGCLDGRFAGLVTAPLQKSIINDAGIRFTGHTEYLAEITATALPVMMLVAGDLRVALASTHMPLRAVPDYLTAERLRAVLQVLLVDLKRRFGLDRPRVLVCGLNPHAGEGGHLGHEDRDIIAPVVAEFAAAGHLVNGPLPADTVFTPAAGSRDAILAMYHDQGLPVLKFAGFGHAVNLTLGLPLVRASVDHGTALDIAGTGKADAGSLIAALRLAARLTRG